MAAEVTTNIRQVLTSSTNRTGGKSQTIENPKPAGNVETRQELPPAGQNNPSTVTQETTSTQSDLDAAELDKAVDELNSFSQNLLRELKFSIDEDSGRTVIKVIDSESQEIVRQIPPEEVMNVLKTLEENSGLLSGTRV